MMTVQPLSLQQRLVTAMLAAVLVIKLLVPIGWMPTLKADGIRIEFCADYGPVSPAMAQALNDAAQRLAGDDAAPDPMGKASADQPCTYAALSVPAAAFGGLISLPWIAGPQPPLPATLLVSIGHGLAAPPPPPTGPPALI